MSLLEHVATTSIVEVAEESEKRAIKKVELDHEGTQGTANYRRAASNETGDWDSMTRPACYRF